jgi:hypothetical protein
MYFENGSTDAEELCALVSRPPATDAVLYFSAVDRYRENKETPKRPHCDYLGQGTSNLGYMTMVEGPTITLSTMGSPVTVTRGTNLWYEDPGCLIRQFA